MGKMYNESQKQAFMNQFEPRKQNTGNTKNLSKNTFGSIADYEEQRNVDICDISVSEYPEILAQSCKGKVRRFSSYVDRLKVLLRYRTYCETLGLINPVVHFEHAQEKVSYEELIEVFKKYVTAPSIHTPDELYDVCEEAFETRKGETTLEDYLLAMSIMYYYSITEPQMADLKRRDISPTDNGVRIEAGENHIEIMGKCAKVILKISRSLESVVNYNGKTREYSMNRQFVFARVQDVDEESRRKRVNYYFQELSAAIKDNENVPTIAEIKHLGAVYRMAESLIRECITKETFSTYTKEKIYIDYYCHLHRMQPQNVKIAVNTFKALEVKYDVEQEWKYLENINIVK